MLIILLCAVLACGLLFPETPIGKQLHRLLVDLPARKLAEVTPGRLVAALVMFMLIAGVLAYAKEEGAFVMAQAIPEGFVWLTMFDIGAYIDVIALVAIIAAAVRLRAAFAALRSSAERARRWLSRSIGTLRGRHASGARARSLRSGPKTPPPAKGDDGDWPAPHFA